MLQLSPLQHPFLQRDDCLEAMTLLNTIFRRIHRARVPCAMLFLDVAKAFDTVSNKSLFRVAYKAGLPHLRHLYKHSTVQLAGTTTQCGRNVRQGDPLSPLLFIMVIEDVLRTPLPDIGFNLNGHQVGSLAYADNLVLFAKKSSRLQEKLHLPEPSTEPVWHLTLRNLMALPSPRMESGSAWP